MKTHHYIFGLVLFLGVFLGSTFPAVAQEYTQKTPAHEIRMEPHGGSFAVGQRVTITAPEGMRIFWTLHPKRAQGAGNVSEGNTVSFYLSRSVDVGFYAWDKNGNETPLQIVSFEIESPYENEFFRFHAIDPHPKNNFVSTVTFKNASTYSMSLYGWKVISDDYNYILELPDEEIESGEVRRFIYPLAPKSGTVKLVSPNGITKDMVYYNYLGPKYFLQRLEQQGALDTRPMFKKVRHIQE